MEITDGVYFGGIGVMVNTTGCGPESLIYTTITICWGYCSGNMQDCGSCEMGSTPIPQPFSIILLERWW